MPGMLPVINSHCVAQAVRTGLALEAEINLTSVFDRKNYFYPDPATRLSESRSTRGPSWARAGSCSTWEDGSQRTIGITRLHLEMDAGKSIHDRRADATCVDLNRAGVALMEIVSEPDIRSPEEAGLYLRKLRSILRYIGTCDGNMEQGSLRADVNVSVRRPGDRAGDALRGQEPELGPLRHEGDRGGGGSARSRCAKTAAPSSSRPACSMPSGARPAPCAPRKRRTTTATSPTPTFCRSLSTPSGWRPSAPGCPSCPTPGRRASWRTTVSPPTTPACSWRSARLPSTSRQSRRGATASRRPNWVTGTLFGALNRAGIGIEQSPISAAALGALIDRVADGTVSTRAAKDVFEAMVLDKEGRRHHHRRAGAQAGER